MLQAIQKNIIKFNQEQKEVERKTKLYNALEATRLKYIRKNKEQIKEIEKILQKMNKELVDFQDIIASTSAKISELEAEKERNRIEQEAQEKAKNDKDKVLEEINKQLASLDINTQIENKRNEIARLQKELLGADKNVKANEQQIQMFNTNISDINNKINNEHNNLNNIGEIIPSPFNVEDWGIIKQQYLAKKEAIERQEKIKHQIHIVENQKEQKNEELNNIKQQIKTSQEQYEKEKTTYFNNCGVTPNLNETIEEYKTRLLNNLSEEQVALQLALKENKQNFTDYHKDLERLQNSTKPQTHFDSQNATPLFEIVNFKEHVEDKDKETIESLLQHSGLLELLIEEENTREGIILCQENH